MGWGEGGVRLGFAKGFWWVGGCKGVWGGACAYTGAARRGSRARLCWVFGCKSGAISRPCGPAQACSCTGRHPLACAARGLDPCTSSPWFLPFAPALPGLWLQVEAATRSTNKSLQRLVNKLGTKPEDIHAALCKQTVDLVFTAHPTQARWAGGGAAVGLCDSSDQRTSHPHVCVRGGDPRGPARVREALGGLARSVRAVLAGCPQLGRNRPGSSPRPAHQRSQPLGLPRRASPAGHPPVDAEEVRRDKARHGPPAQHAAVQLRAPGDAG